MISYHKTSTCIVWLVLFLGFMVPASAVTFYVKHDAAGSNTGADWANAYTDLQNALDVAVSGDQIWVAAGIYYPSVEVGGTGSRYQTFQMINDVGIYGGFTGVEDPATFDLADRDFVVNETILSGDIGTLGDETDNCYHVFYHDGIALDSTAMLDGFTITAGNADDVYPDDSGAGIFNYTCSPSVSNCTFSNNTAAYLGGGISNEEGSNTVVTCCTFSGNMADIGAGMYNYSSSPSVTGCIFSGNYAVMSGGCIANEESSNPTITGCTFSGNAANSYAGGMDNLFYCNPIVTSCIFVGNLADTGGGMNNEEYCCPTVTNCVFTGNIATSYGGGMENFFSSDPAVINCTFSGNTADTGGGMDNYENSLTIENSIFWNNSAASFGNEIANDTSTPFIAHCNIQDGLPVGSTDGGGNIDADPIFADVDLRLNDGSPCINAGDNSAVPVGVVTDLDGRPRIMDGVVDMGAYEYESGQPDIEVNPHFFDFGSVEVGSAVGVILTISNMGNADLTINSLDINLNDEFYIQNPPVVPFTISAESGLEIEVIFEALTEGPSASTLEIGSDDIDEPIVEVQLSGMGVVPYLTISEQIENILDFIDASVADGSLVGKGPGKSGKNRLRTFIKMVEKIRKDIDKEHYTPAGNKLNVVHKRCSTGSSGFVGGQAVEELVEMLMQLKTSLEIGDCENIVVTDESHVFNDPFPFILNERNVDINSILVTDITGIFIYTEADDYTINVIGNEIEITCTPLGVIPPNIVDGQKLLVDYTYNTCDWAVPEEPEED